MMRVMSLSTAFYVAAASSERARARSFAEALEKTGRHSCLFEWFDAFPDTHERDLDAAARELLRRRCVNAAAMADLFVLLAPSSGHTTTGAWIELGVRVAARRLSGLLVAGGERPSTLFLSGVVYFVSDHLALTAIREERTFLDGPKPFPLDATRL